MDRILGLDFGNKRIGISISDPSNIFALPHAIYLYAIKSKTLQS